MAKRVYAAAIRCFGISICAHRRTCRMQDNHLITLANQAKGGDADAFAKLIHLCTKDMYRVAFAILMNDENAADAIQDAVLTCWEKISALKEPKYFKTWLTRILIHREAVKNLVSMGI